MPSELLRKFIFCVCFHNNRQMAMYYVTPTGKARWLLLVKPQFIQNSCISLLTIRANILNTKEKLGERSISAVNKRQRFDCMLSLLVCNVLLIIMKFNILLIIMKFKILLIIMKSELRTNVFIKCIN